MSGEQGVCMCVSVCILCNFVLCVCVCVCVCTSCAYFCLCVVCALCGVYFVYFCLGVGACVITCMHTCLCGDVHIHMLCY